MKPTGLFWWIDRWRKSTAFMDMTLEEQGAYRNLLDEAHLRGGPLPNDERILAKACGDATAWPRIKAVVMARFTLESDGWRNETMDEVYRKTLQLSEERSKAGQAGNRKRWGKDIATPIANTIANASSPSPSPSPSLSQSQDSLVSNNKQNSRAFAAKGGMGGNGANGRAVASRLSGRPLSPLMKENLSVVTKIAHTIIDAEPKAQFADWKEAIRVTCAKSRITYDSELAGMALESALAQRKHA